MTAWFPIPLFIMSCIALVAANAPCNVFDPCALGGKSSWDLKLRLDSSASEESLEKPT